MTNLYIITGPAGVGKSTISKKIAESKKKSALIEGDDIYHQVIGGYVQAWKEVNHEKMWKNKNNILEFLKSIIKTSDKIIVYLRFLWYYIVW